MQSCGSNEVGSQIFSFFYVTSGIFLFDYFTMKNDMLFYFRIPIY